MSLKTIKAFYIDELQKTVELEGVSKWLTEIQAIPQMGNAVVIFKEDAEKMGLAAGSVEYIQTVKRVWFNYYNCDVAIIVHYEAW